MYAFLMFLFGAVIYGIPTSNGFYFPSPEFLLAFLVLTRPADMISSFIAEKVDQYIINPIRL